MNPARDAFFEEMAIRIQSGGRAQFFYGDNVEGYWEGFTHSYAKGTGYLLSRQVVFRDFMTWCGSRMNDRERAEEAAIYPYGVRHTFALQTWEEGMLLGRQQAIALRVVSRRAQPLAVAPLLEAEGLATVEPAGDTWVLRVPGAHYHVGVSASHPFSYAGQARETGRNAPIFRSRDPLREFTLYLAFGKSVQEAAAKAARLRDQQGVEHHKKRIFDLLTRSDLQNDHSEYTKAVRWAKLSSLFLVTEEYGKGIWAGLPWFKDNWGRDTFIALPGTLLVTGQFSDAREVIEVFAGRQDRDPKSPVYGRVPNRVSGEGEVIYNTADGTPWLIREIGEYVQYTGDANFEATLFPIIECAIDGTFKKFGDRYGFVTHDDADTWMDARINGQAPWSARGNRANDIQALWHAALGVGIAAARRIGRRTAIPRWRARAEKLASNFHPAFWDPRKKALADRLRPDGTRDLKPRPNQLMLLSIPFDDGLLPPDIEARVLKNAFEELCFPYGICSLSPRHSYFHPYHHRDDLWHFDAAYHNGTIWGWNAGFTITALCRHRQIECAWALARNLADQILNLGCRGGMSELLDALPDSKGNITPSGTWQQAWSTAEFARTAYQDFAGFRPRLMENRLILRPHIPEEWRRLRAVLPFATDSSLDMLFLREAGKDILMLQLRHAGQPLEIDVQHDTQSWRHRAAFQIRDGESVTLVFEGPCGTIGSKGRPIRDIRAVPLKVPRPLRFATPPVNRRFPTLLRAHYLQRIIESGRFK
ncbi:MAG: glycogen debranching protein [Kiritimatiellae bacterium]|nr:glycogen debranching protein [Kiritimatiellia bacterium]MDW8457797.1 amylo-alpha-1,6-glucosidase [Verrucomicrobiota bacterium]